MCRLIACLLCCAVLGCGPRATAPLTPLPQGRIGAVDRFGPGIVAASSQAVRFALTRAASVIVLQVSGSGIIAATS